jgi:transcriptional regulator with GAF, ATPase, and Fis domain
VRRGRHGAPWGSDSTPRAALRPDTWTLEESERDHIVATLERTSWRIAGEGGAAALLTINPSTLRSRIQKLGIVRPGSRPADGPGLA